MTLKIVQPEVKSPNLVHYYDIEPGQLFRHRSDFGSDEPQSLRLKVIGGHIELVAYYSGIEEFEFCTDDTLSSDREFYIVPGTLTVSE